MASDEEALRGSGLREQEEIRLTCLISGLVLNAHQPNL